ncbi:MAG TPA: DUF6261 family protein, partial [Paludibacter sp.]
LDRLSIENVAALINLTIDDALLVKPEIGEMGSAALTELDQTGRAFRAQTNRSKKSQLTDQVNMERKVCVDGYAEIKKTVVFESSSRIEPRKKAANDLEFYLKPNWDITKSPIGDQIDQTVKMVSLYRTNPLLVNAAQTIGVDVFIDELEANNTALSVTFKARELEDGKQGASGSDLRPAATDSYNRFCSIIEQAANFTPNPAILDLFIKMDMLRKRYHALQSGGKDKGTAPSA